MWLLRLAGLISTSTNGTKHRPELLLIFLCHCICPRFILWCASGRKDGFRKVAWYHIPCRPQAWSSSWKQLSEVSVFSAPCSARQSYCKDAKSGAHVVRPYNLGWRSDFGLAYICEPEELMFLSQLIATTGPLGSELLESYKQCALGAFATLISDSQNLYIGWPSFWMLAGFAPILTSLA